MSPAMPRSPNSLTRIARRRPCGFCIRWRTSVVFPAPRKPVMMVTGTFSIDMRGSGLDGWRDARDHTLAEDRRPLPPRHQPVRGGRVAQGAGEQLIDRSLVEIAVDIAPASRPGERHAAAAIAVGKTLGFDDAKAGRVVRAAERIGQRVMQPAAGPRHGFAVFAGEAGDADVQGHRGIGGLRYCLFARRVWQGLVHSKARRWMATAQGGTQTCGERTCTPFDQLSHSGTPRPEWRKWQATAGFLAHGSSPAPPSRANGPVAFGAGFPLTVAGAAPASLKPGNHPVSSAPGIPS